MVGYASLALVLFLIIAGFRGFSDLTLARAREDKLEASIGSTEREIERLERRVERLRSDPVLLERLAREELGMVRADEVVVILEPEPRAAAAPPTAALGPPPPPPLPSSDRREPASP